MRVRNSACVYRKRKVCMHSEHTGLAADRRLDCVGDFLSPLMFLGRDMGLFVHGSHEA